MRISYNWLKDYITVKLTPEKLAELLTMSGLTIDAMHTIPGDTVLEVEVTANRPDWLSYIGVARELSALTGASLKLPIIRHCEGTKCPKQSSKERLLRQASPSSQRQVKIEIEDKKLCPRYTARIINDVKVGESPEWLKTKLEAMGLRSVNNVVDITNFCLFETGEPMHAFDLDKIAGGAIIVRHARRGEKILTIDGVERTLEESDLVIADKEKPIAIAGVMGGLNTEVNHSTSSILLEAAYFDPISVRRTARRLAISTESSYRFERKVDPANIVYSSDRCASLILEAALGKIGSFTDIGLKVQAKKAVTLNFKKLDSVLGIEVPITKAKSILSALGLKIKTFTKDNMIVEPPAFRYDLNNEIDLIEEVARIYGYDKVPLTLPPVVDQPVRIPYDAVIEKKIRCALTSCGMSEIITYSLLGKKLLKMAALPEEGTVEIKNPLTSEQEAMRTSLIPGMLNAVLWNLNRKAKDLKLFELGNVYIKEGDNKFTEKSFLSLGMTGPATFFDLKGAVEALFGRLGIENVSFKDAKDPSFSQGSCASIEINNEAAGIIGDAAKNVLNNFDIKEKVYIAELSVDAIIKSARLEKRFVELAKYPSVFRDISLVVGRDISNAGLTGLICGADKKLTQVILIDRYVGKQVPEGKISLTYRLEYRDPNKTLEEKEVSEIHSKILRALEEKFGAKLR